MVKYGNLVFLNLRNLFVSKPEVGADNTAGNIGGVRGDATAGISTRVLMLYSTPCCRNPEVISPPAW